MTQYSPIEEYRAAFLGCIGKHIPTQAPIHISEVVASLDNAEGILVKGSILLNNTWIPQMALPSHISYAIPQLGYFNINNYVVNVQQSPNRQWKKGYNEGIIKINYIETRMLRDISFIAPNIRIPSAYNASLINQIYSPTYFPFKRAAIDVFSGEAIARALSHTLAVCATNSSVASLFYKQYKIGIVKENIAEVHSKLLFLKEELEDKVDVQWVN